MNRHSVPLAGVAQRRERRVHPGDAGSVPVPRSIHPFQRPRPVRRLEPIMIAAIGAAGGIVLLVFGLLGWAAWACCGGML